MPEFWNNGRATSSLARSAQLNVSSEDVSEAQSIGDPLDATVEAAKAFEALRLFRPHFGNVTAELGEGQPAC